MNNVSTTIWNKKMPSLFGFFFLMLAIGTITWLSRNAILFGTKAAVDNTPKNIKVSNITNTSFTVSYFTNDTVLGTLKFGQNGTLNQIALDDRDQAKGTPTPSTVHSITVRNLTPTTQYSFSITSGDQNFLKNTIPFTVTTGAVLEESASEEILLTGKIMLDDGSLPAEALVTVSSSTSQLLSTLVAPDGTYKLNLGLMRDKTLASLMKFDPETVLQLQINDPTKTSTVSLLKNQIDPVPLVILSKNYDFATSDQPIEPSPIASESADETFPISDDTTSDQPKIITPQEEQTFNDQQPLFKGKAVPNESVTITINSEQTITATVQADSNGNWQYRPDEPLEPGTHTITIRTLDTDGLIRIITQSFVVYAEGSQFTEPSISPSQTISPTTKPTATPTAKPINTPTQVPLEPTKPTTTPSASPTLTSTPTPTKQTVTLTISPTKPPLPVSGNTTLLVTMIGIISAIGIGALLFLFTAV